jgi:opacity protein-like surface antigen
MMMIVRCSLMLSAAVFASVTARATYYVRPAIYIFPYANGEASTSASVGVAVGIYLGHEERHDVSLEAGMKIEDSDFVRQALSPGDWRYKHWPVLARYHYRWLLGSGKVQLYAGPTLGFTRSENHENATVGGVPVVYDRSAWNFTWGASAGIGFRLADHFDADIGVRSVQIRKGDFSAGRTDNFSATGISAGVAWRF